MNFRLGWTRPAIFAMAGLLVACGSLKEQGAMISDFIQPYRVEIVQGNVVTREQLAVLRPGLTRNQVREVLGSPLIASLFHAERWDYTFAIRRKGTEPLLRRVSVFFEGDRMTRVEADELPTEAEFTARIDSRLQGKAKIPPLEAKPEDLKAFLPKEAPATSPDTPLPPVNMAYPPLEPQ
ncbi:MAG: outer membrane protein assembly factor BamE precursor [Pseudomonadota bacterium]